MITKTIGTRINALWQDKKTRTALIAAAVLIAGLALFLLIRGGTKRPDPAAFLQRGYLEQTIEADGIVESAQKTEVHAPSGLRVKEIYVYEGSVVSEGDLLARLDTEALELEIQRAELNIKSAETNMTSEQTALANSVTSARNALSSAEVSLQTAQREYNTLLEQQGSETAVTAAGINLEAARRAYSYNSSLYEINGVSQEMLIQSKNALDKAQSAYEDALRESRDSLERARETMNGAQIRQKTAQDTLSDAIAKNTDPAAIALELQRVVYNEKLLRLREAGITAPAGGIVTLVSAKEGAPASGLMFVIEDDRALIVRARVAETDVASLSLGTQCLIRPAGGEQSLHGAVTLLPFAAERDATGVFSAVIGDDVYFIVEAAIDQAQPGVLIGMNTRVSFIVGVSESCFTAPNGLIYRDGDRRWIIARGRNGRITEIEVETGLETRRVTEIIAESLYEGMALYNKTK